MKLLPLSIFACSILFLNGCQTKPPIPVPTSNPPVAAVQENTEAHMQQEVTWGGVILETTSKQEATEIIVLSKRLESSARPVEGDQTTGRFIAIINGFLDPAVYAEGRELSVYGKVSGSVSRNIGDFSYHYPTVVADAYYLWPVRIQYDDRDDFWYGPWYYPYPYYHHHHYPRRKLEPKP